MTPLCRRTARVAASVSEASSASTMRLSAVAAGRRWARLAASGTAWTGSTLGPELFRSGFLDIRCRPGTVDSVAAALWDLADVITMGRRRRLRVIRDHRSRDGRPIDRALLEGVTALGVERLRAQIYTRVHGGPNWRLNVLNRAQSSLMRQDGKRLSLEASVPTQGKRLFSALFEDARRSYVDLAHELDSTPQVVRRRLAPCRRAARSTFGRTSPARWPVIPSQGCCGSPLQTRSSAMPRAGLPGARRPTFAQRSSGLPTWSSSSTSGSPNT